VWSRNRGDYDLLVYVANWPAARSLAWKTLLRARAIENQAYVCGVNRIGEDGRGTPHNGGSMAVGPEGQVIAQAEDNAESLTGADLDLRKRQLYLEKFPAYKDADDFLLQ
jgi:predicted amidohydrolase